MARNLRRITRPSAKPPAKSGGALAATGDVSQRLRQLERELRAEIDPHARARIISQIVPTYISRGDRASAADYLARIETLPTDGALAACILALRAVVEAMQHGPNATRADIHAALDMLAYLEPYDQAVVLQRAGLVGFYTGDLSFAQEHSLRAIALCEETSAYLLAAYACTVLYAAAYQLTGNLTEALLWSERTALFAAQAQNEPLKRNALVAQYDLAAALGNVDRARGLRALLQRQPAAEQFRETFNLALSDALLLGWEREFDVMLATLERAAERDDVTEPDLLLLRGLKALALVALGDDAAGRREARRVISQASNAPRAENTEQADRRHLGRTLAAAASILAGDRYNGIRAATRKSISVSPSARTIGAAVAVGRYDVSDPSLRFVRGYVLLLEAVRAARNQPTAAVLTRAEREVLRHVAMGQSYSAIARTLGKSVHTVRVQSRSIYAKLSVDNKVEAVLRAQKLDIL